MSAKKEKVRWRKAKKPALIGDQNRLVLAVLRTEKGREMVVVPSSCADA